MGAGLSRSLSRVSVSSCGLFSHRRVSQSLCAAPSPRRRHGSTYTCRCLPMVHHHLRICSRRRRRHHLIQLRRHLIQLRRRAHQPWRTGRRLHLPRAFHRRHHRPCRRRSAFDSSAPRAPWRATTQALFPAARGLTMQKATHSLFRAEHILSDRLSPAPHPVCTLGETPLQGEIRTPRLWGPVLLSGRGCIPRALPDSMSCFPSAASVVEVLLVQSWTNSCFCRTSRRSGTGTRALDFHPPAVHLRLSTCGT